MRCYLRFALEDFASGIVLIGTSDVAERQCHILHTSCEPFLLINQYRPPHYGEVLSIQSMYDDMRSYGLDVFGTLIIGDFNVHNKQWLEFSFHDPPEGYALRNFYRQHALRELCEVLFT